VASAAVHLLLILTAPAVLERATPTPSFLRLPPAIPEDVRMLIIAEPLPEAPAQVTPPETVTAPAQPSAPVPTTPPLSVLAPPAVTAPGAGVELPSPAVAGGAPAVQPGGAGLGGGSAADRLRPGTMNERLWTMNPEAARFTPAQLAQLQILWAILDMNDSLAAAEASARRMTDWTFTDASGGKWGISEGKIHLGDITLPLPAFGAPAGSAAAQREWVDREIARGAAAAAARANMNERIKAIRERLERERQERERAVPPDTTRQRR
jgi:hypothetical protein